MCKVKHIFGLFAHAYDLRVYVLFIQPAGCLPAYVLNNNVLIVLLLNECANRYFTHAARTTKRNHNYCLLDFFAGKMTSNINQNDKCLEGCRMAIRSG